WPTTARSAGASQKSCAAASPFAASAPSSVASGTSFAPQKPPAAFFSAIASSTALRLSIPQVAAAAVGGPPLPLWTSLPPSCADAGGARASATTARLATAKSRMATPPSERVQPRRALSPAPTREARVGLVTCQTVIDGYDLNDRLGSVERPLRVCA